MGRENERKWDRQSPKSRGPPGGPGREPPLLEAERPQSANSPRFELIRVCHGGELPAAQVSRQNFLGNGGLRDPPHRRLDAETLSRPDGEMESDLDSARTGGRIASVPGHTALSSSCRVASHAFCLLAVVPTHPAIGNSGRLLKEFKVIFRDDGAVTTAEAQPGRHGLPGWDSLPLRVRQRGQRFAVSRDRRGGIRPVRGRAVAGLRRGSVPLDPRSLAPLARGCRPHSKCRSCFP